MLPVSPTMNSLKTDVDPEEATFGNEISIVIHDISMLEYDISDVENCT